MIPSARLKKLFLVRTFERSSPPHEMALREAWTTAAPGRLSPAEQCKLWALRQVLRMQGEDDEQYDWMASQVTVMGGGHPGRQSVRDFFKRVDAAGDSWYPGVSLGKRGRPLEMTKKKRQALAKSMMAAKARGEMPCYDTALAYCETSTFNDKAQAVFSRGTINKVLTTDCYDETPDRPWEFRYGAKRRPLTAEAKELRTEWAERILQEGHTAAWFHDNIVWMDICSKVIPGTPSVALDQARTAQNKKKRLMSPGATEKSINLGGSVTADKQCGYGSTRVYFGVVLARGRVGVVVSQTWTSTRVRHQRVRDFLWSACHAPWTRCSAARPRNRASCSPTAGLGSTTGDGGRSPATTSLLAASTGSSFGPGRIPRKVLVLSLPTWQTSYSMRRSCLGSAAGRSVPGQRGLGRKHHTSWRYVCSRLQTGPTRGSTAAACAWVCPSV